MLAFHGAGDYGYCDFVWLEPYKHTALAAGAFGDQDSLITTIIKTVPLLIAGLGVAVAFRGGLFNIGVEGQLFVGSIATVIVGTRLHAPAYLHIPLTLLAGALAGALWASIPGYLKAKYGANEVITTIMTNYIAIASLPGRSVATPAVPVWYQNRPL
jgi:simple sugar transport system permease protein